MAKIVFVVAAARNGVIGSGGRIPWRLPSDMKGFKQTTWGRPMIMGRKTWDSIGRPLPGRETIVVTRDASFRADGAHVAQTPDAALALAQERAEAMGVNEIMVVGGAEIYRALAQRADRIVLTEVDMAPEGDAFFPAPDPAVWTEVATETPPRAEKDDAAIVIRTFERRPDRQAPPAIATL
ncbi:MAG: dihydrofolate reductase [Beijerinckiaceae bacterium]